jgi:hypothetical protein
MQKTRYVLITLFAPELSIFAAVRQLRDAWKLRLALQTIQRREQGKHSTAAAEVRYIFDYV